MTNDSYSSSIYIILNQFKNSHITEEEAVQLIEDLYRNKDIYVPTFPSWDQIIYKQPHYEPFKVTCNKQ